MLPNFPVTVQLGSVTRRPNKCINTRLVINATKHLFDFSSVFPVLVILNCICIIITNFNSDKVCALGYNCVSVASSILLLVVLLFYNYKLLYVPISVLKQFTETTVFNLKLKCFAAICYGIPKGTNFGLNISQAHSLA